MKTLWMPTSLILAVAASACGLFQAVGPGGEEAGDVAAEGLESAEATPPPIVSADLVRPEDLVYRGAFRLPGADERPKTFAYGGAAMTFRPDGDAEGDDDGFPGSLFVMGHDRLPYGELPDGNQIAELAIPAPVIADTPEALPTATFLQDFADVAGSAFDGLDEIPRAGLLYLDAPETGPGIHLAWGQHLQPDPAVPSHAWIDPLLSSPALQGPWFIAGLSPYSANGYLLEIPADWAHAYAQGRVVGAGRYRDGGWSGMGPALVAYQPWVDADGTPASAGANLEATVLLLYQDSTQTDSIEHALQGYQHPDEWEGAAWVTSPSGRSAVLFVGTKATGDKYWYGYIHPGSADLPCVDVDMVGQMTTCRLADGSPCSQEDLGGCGNHTDYRGWWSTRFDAQFLLYDPADLARVATGEMESWEPQPYARIDVDEHLFLNPARVEEDLLGTGDQRRYRLGEVAYDRENGLLYVLELFADGAKPVVHVWQVQ